MNAFRNSWLFAWISSFSTTGSCCFGTTFAQEATCICLILNSKLSSIFFSHESHDTLIVCLIVHPVFILQCRQMIHLDGWSVSITNQAIRICCKIKVELHVHVQYNYKIGNTGISCYNNLAKSSWRFFRCPFLSFEF